MSDFTFHSQGYPLWLAVVPQDALPVIKTGPTEAASTAIHKWIKQNVTADPVIGWAVADLDEDIEPKLHPATADGSIWVRTRPMYFGPTEDAAVMALAQAIASKYERENPDEPKVKFY